MIVMLNENDLKQIVVIYFSDRNLVIRDNDITWKFKDAKTKPSCEVSVTDRVPPAESGKPS